MKWTEQHSYWFAKALSKNLKNQKSIQFLKNDSAVVQEICRIIADDLLKEQELEKEVVKMLNELEQSHGTSFNRQKMRLMLRQKLAEKKGIIL